MEDGPINPQYASRFVLQRLKQQAEALIQAEAGSSSDDPDLFQSGSSSDNPDLFQSDSDIPAVDEEKKELPATSAEILEFLQSVDEAELKEEVVGLPAVPNRAEAVAELLKSVREDGTTDIDTADFSRETVKNAIGSTFNPDGTVVGFVTDPEAIGQRLAADFSAQFAKGLAIAQRAAAPNVIRDVIGTISKGIEDFVHDVGDEEVKQQIVSTAELTLGIIIPQAREVGLDPGTPIEDLRRISGLEDDVKELSRERLEVDDINRIRESFLKNIIQNRLGTTDLLLLSKNISDTVVNPTLKKVLQEDINQRILSTGFQQQSQFRQVEVKTPFVLEIIDKPHIERVDKGLQATLRRLESDLKEGENKNVIRKKVSNLAKDLNARFIELQIRDGRGQIPKLRIKQSTATEMLQDLQKQVRNFTGTKNISFFTSTFSPSTTEQDQDALVTELLKVTEGPRRVTHPTSTSTFGDTISVQQEGGMYEIFIQEHTHLEDILKLADALSKEDGILENLTSSLELDIKKNQDMHSITKFIQKAYEAEGGTHVTLLYTPRNPQGGHHVGGALSIIYDKKITPPATTFDDHTRIRGEEQLLGHTLGDLKYGGKVKISDIAGGVGTVATGLAASGIGAPLALPVAAVSGIIKGLGSIFGF